MSVGCKPIRVYYKANDWIVTNDIAHGYVQRMRQATKDGYLHYRPDLLSISVYTNKEFALRKVQYLAAAHIESLRRENADRCVQEPADRSADTASGESLHDV